MEKIVVSRKWNNPEVTAFMENNEVGAKISLDDFINGVVEEVGNPTSLVTKQALKNRLIIASSEVIKEMKKQTVHL